MTTDELIPETPDVVAVTVDGSELRQAIKRVRHAASEDYSRPILSTILFEPVGDNHLRLVAADNFRLAYMGVHADGDTAALGRFCIDVGDADQLRSFLRGYGKTTVTIEREDSAVTFRADTRSRSVTYRTVDGTFPDYMKAVVGVVRTDPRTVRLNPWLLDGLRKSGSLTLAMTVGGPEEVVAFVDLADEFHEYIMPVRVAGSES